MLLPPCLEDFVEEGHLVRTIDEIVEKLDTTVIEARYSEVGRPAYHPKVLLKILLYAYSIGLRSSRKIEEACKSNIYFMYLSGMLKPDFWTLCDFRRKFPEGIESIFVQIVRLCLQMGVLIVGSLSIDGSKLRASASPKKSKKKDEIEKMIENIRQEVKSILQEAEQVDEEENALYGDKRGDELPKELHKKEVRLKKLEEALKTLEEEDKKTVNITDPDANFMKLRHGVIQPAYNAQVVAASEQVIVAYDLVTAASDFNQLLPMIEKAEGVTQKKVEEVKADCGYASYDNYEALTKTEIKLYLPDLQFVKERKAKMEGKDYAPPKQMQDKEGVKLALAMREKLKDPVHYAKYKERMYEVEPIFGNIKHNLGCCVDR